MTVIRAVLLVVAALVASPGPVRAQLPTEFENLQLLPDDIEQRELLDVMVGFSTHLNVRCQFCHVGEEGQPLGTFDFVSDEKATKRTARLMLRMTQAINGDWVSEVERPEGERVKVQCVTCHRGQSRPQLLQEVLLARVADEGVTAAIAEYRQLREQYYGRHTFDFGESTLNDVAAALAARDQRRDALEILELNREFFPDSASLHYRIGRLHAEMKQTSEAIRYLERSLALNANNRQARELLEKLRQ